MGLSVRKAVALVAAGGITMAALVAAPAPARASRGTDVARYILPAGNYGGLPTNANSRDQLPLYDGLTPLRGNVTDADINSHFLPEDFTAGRRDPRGGHRPRRRDDHLRQLRRGPRQGRHPRRRGLRRRMGDGPRPRPADPARTGSGAGGGGRRPRHRRVLAGHQRPVVRAQRRRPRRWSPRSRTCSCRPTATRAARSSPTPRPRPTASTPTGPRTGVNQPPATVNDVIATAAFIGSIFGAGGGGEATNSDLLAQLQNQLGPVRGHQAWNDAMLSDDPEAPTTTKRQLRLRPADRWRRHRLGHHRRRLDRRPRPPPGRRGRTRRPRHRRRSGADRRRHDRRTRCWSTPRPRRRTSRRRTSWSWRRDARRPATRWP